MIIVQEAEILLTVLRECLMVLQPCIGSPEMIGITPVIFKSMIMDCQIIKRDSFH